MLWVLVHEILCEPHKLARRKGILYSGFTGEKKSVKVHLFHLLKPMTLSPGAQHNFKNRDVLNIWKLTATAVAAVSEQKIRKLMTMMIPAVKIVLHGFLFMSCGYEFLNLELLQGPALPAQILLYLAKTDVPRTLSVPFLTVKILFKTEEVRGLQDLEISQRSNVEKLFSRNRQNFYAKGEKEGITFTNYVPVCGWKELWEGKNKVSRHFSSQQVRKSELAWQTAIAAAFAICQKWNYLQIMWF